MILFFQRSARKLEKFKNACAEFIFLLRKLFPSSLDAGIVVISLLFKFVIS